jgi:cytochrome c oxidase subunit II
MKRSFARTLAVWATVSILFTASLRAQEASRTIEVHAKRFAFSPSEISIRKGETVKLVLISDDVTHSLVVPDLHINQELKKGHPSEIEVTPANDGDFHGKCGHFCGSGHARMVFVVHVVD